MKLINQKKNEHTKNQCPEGFEIDKDKSTFEEIVFKPIKEELPKTWEELVNVKGHYVDADSYVKPIYRKTSNYHRNIFATEEQAKAAIALAQLSQLREVYRQGWVPDWNRSDQTKYVIYYFENKIKTESIHHSSYFLSFQSAKVRDQFLKNFKDLIEEASPLLFG